MCFKKVWKLCEVLYVRVTAGHGPAQAQEEPAEWGALSQFLFGVTKSFCKIKFKFLSFRVLAGGFVMGCQKSLGFKHFVIGCAKRSWF